MYTRLEDLVAQQNRSVSSSISVGALLVTTRLSQQNKFNLNQEKYTKYPTYMACVISHKFKK